MFPLHDDIEHQRLPLVTVGLILVNILVFVYEMSLGAGIKGFVYQFGFVPMNLTEGATAAQRVLPLYTSMFLHANIFHVLGNCWYLWIFGDNVEDKTGHLGFLIFYLVSGMGASFLHYAFNAQSTMPAIGASGAIAGVLGAYFVMYPRAKVSTLMTLGYFWRVVEIPAVFYLGLWFAWEIFSGMMASGSRVVGGVAFWAHVGGFAAGAVLALLFFRKE